MSKKMPKDLFAFALFFNILFSASCGIQVNESPPKQEKEKRRCSYDPLIRGYYREDLVCYASEPNLIMSLSDNILFSEKKNAGEFDGWYSIWSPYCTDNFQGDNLKLCAAPPRLLWSNPGGTLLPDYKLTRPVICYFTKCVNLDPESVIWDEREIKTGLHVVVPLQKPKKIVLESDRTSCFCEENAWVFGPR